MKETIIITPFKIIAKSDTATYSIDAKTDAFMFNYITSKAETVPVEDLFTEIVNVYEDVQMSDKINRDFILPDGMQLVNGQLFYKTMCLSGNFVRRFELSNQKNINNIMKFLNKLINVNARDVFEMICGFLEANPDIMIDNDGDLLMWKIIKSDYSAHHQNPDGTHNIHIKNLPIEMSRDEVERDSNVTCSRGLHVCAKSYLPVFYDIGDIVCLCKVDVRDIVSIPYDYNNAKVRCCRYTPLEFYNWDGCDILDKCTEKEEKRNKISRNQIKCIKDAVIYTDDELYDIINAYMDKQTKSRTIRELQHNCSKLKGVSVKTIYDFFTKYIDHIPYKVTVNKKKPSISNIKISKQ